MENEKIKKQEELQSRRDFFKKAAKGVLPVIGAIVLANSPLLAKADEIEMGCKVCTNGCRNHCDDGCEYTCSRGCKNGCGGCDNKCSGSCKSTCYGSCKNLSK